MGVFWKGLISAVLSAVLASAPVMISDPTFMEHHLKTFGIGLILVALKSIRDYLTPSPTEARNKDLLESTGGR
jgi:hypothetical protein